MQGGRLFSGSSHVDKFGIYPLQARYGRIPPAKRRKKVLSKDVERLWGPIHGESSGLHRALGTELRFVARTHVSGSLPTK